MKKIILALLLIIAMASCKKEPMYLPKPSRDVYQIKSMTDGLMVSLYETQVTSTYQIDKGQTKEYSTSTYYKIMVECPSENCTYYLNGSKLHEGGEFTPGDYR